MEDRFCRWKDDVHKMNLWHTSCGQTFGKYLRFTYADLSGGVNCCEHCKRKVIAKGCIFHNVKPEYDWKEILGEP